MLLTEEISSSSKL